MITQVKKFGRARLSTGSVENKHGGLSLNVVYISSSNIQEKVPVSLNLNLSHSEASGINNPTLSETLILKTYLMKTLYPIHTEAKTVCFVKHGLELFSS